jgi:hypothetical protein
VGDGQPAGQFQVARFLVQLAQQQREQARLAAAVRTDYTDLLAGVQGEVDAFEQQLAAARERELKRGEGSQIIMPKTISSNDNAALGPIECQSRLGGLLNYYDRKAA